MKSIFSGVCTALVTPFKNGEVDYDAFEKILEFQIKSGVNALCILGTTGEAPTLTFDEKIEIVKFSIAKVNGRVPLVFGIGGNNPKEIIKLGLEVKTCGGQAVMLSSPYYNKCTQAAAVIFFHSIANAIKLPMIVYNVPGRTGMNLEPATLQKICENKWVAGIKEASGNMTQIIDVVRLCPKTAVYCGDDGLALPCYACGCKGVISVASNVRPKETLEIMTMKSHELFLNEIPYYKALFCEVNPAPVKYAMSLMNLCQADVRPPLTQLSEKSIMDYGFCQFFKPVDSRKLNRNK
ncbi:MAG: 4-hydroxy-tetrahydrodipicolinate synthase [Christensenellaceae bacterium]|jgi:4-hydroxy-tetrahydrodipicolinate synthase|nr:4-hydroxy-tetrahydrodipicolinate synthase [Christensenellaceae bacterium]